MKNYLNQGLQRRILDLSFKHKLSHLSSNLSCVDLVKLIYEAKRPTEAFVMDNGHAHLAHLVVKEAMGILDAEKMLEKYGIHCDVRAGCDVSTGSLGQGLPIAVGLALADREHRVYCMVSEGSMAEGSVWEALRIAKELRLGNLYVVGNFNGFNALGKVDTRDLVERISAFGWSMVTIAEPRIDEWRSVVKAHLSIQPHPFFLPFPSFIAVSTNNVLPLLDGVQGHYKVLNKEEYEYAKTLL